MKESTKQKIQELTERLPELTPLAERLAEAVEAICECYLGGGKLLVCGNGGSAADAEHIVGELMKGFLLPRRLDGHIVAQLQRSCPQDARYLTENLQGTLAAVSLVNQVALNTAFANDQAADLAFAQQVLGLGRPGDVLLAISTSGNSPNVVYAVKVAKAKGLVTIALTGESGGKLREVAQTIINAPAKETYRVQEYHLPIYHMICAAVENEFFGS